MKKILNIFFVLVLLASFSSAIKISPTQKAISMNQYETNCTNIWVLPESNYLISSKWSNDGYGDLSKYVLSPEKIKLKINYSYIENGKYEICFTPERAGNLSGIIYFYDEKNMVEIGSWVDLKIEQIGTIEKINLITGNTIKKYDVNGTNVGLSMVFVLLFTLLIVLIYKGFLFGSVKHKYPQIDNSA